MRSGAGKHPPSNREAGPRPRRERTAPPAARPTARGAPPRRPAGGDDSAGRDDTTALPIPSLPISARPPDAAEASAPSRARRRFLGWRSANRRVTVQSRSPAVWLGEHLVALGRRLLFLGKILAALAVLLAVVTAGRVAVRHVVNSPRFALREIRVASVPVHVETAEIIERTGVQVGDRLLALDTDRIAARLARHPWIASARVRRDLPSTLVIDVTERRPAAVAVLEGLYLIDDQGHPFKRATLEEADGHVVLTGISRTEFLALPRATEAAFREALALVDEYQHPDTLAAAKHAGTGKADGKAGETLANRTVEAPKRAGIGSPVTPEVGKGGGRPALSEVHVDPQLGFSLFLYDGGAEIRLGRGNVADKLARLDEILAEFGPRGVGALKVVHLDGPAGDRVPIRLAVPAEDPAPAETGKPATGAKAKGRPAAATALPTDRGR